jgi:hypothetical protein
MTGERETGKITKGPLWSCLNLNFAYFAAFLCELRGQKLLHRARSQTLTATHAKKEPQSTRRNSDSGTTAAFVALTGPEEGGESGVAGVQPGFGASNW